MKSNKKLLLVFAAVLLILVGVVFIIIRPSYSEREVIIHGDNHNPANLMQLNATVVMGTDGEELFFYTGKRATSDRGTSFLGKLAVFRDKSVKKLDTPGPIEAMADGYCYYFTGVNPSFGGGKGTPSLNAMRLSDGKKSVLLADNALSDSYLTDVTASGQLLLRYNNFHPEGYPIRKDVLEELTEYRFICGDSIYTPKSSSSEKCKFVKLEGEDRVNPVQQVSSSHYQFLLPRNDALLLIDVVNSKPLFRINSDGTSEQLFSLPCAYMESAFNLHGDAAFLSCQCYTLADNALQYEFERYVPYNKGQADPSGTYRVDLTTGETKKLSNAVYTGLYIFDDSGIYACDQAGRIFLLDFDGNVVDTLVKN